MSYVFLIVGSVLGTLPEADEVRQIGLDTVGSSTERTTPASVEHETTSGGKPKSAVSPFILSEALPVVPAKLVKKIVRGEFVDMVELLQDNMEAERRRANGEGESALPRRREVPDILSWLQCFSMYAAVVGVQYPEKMKDLLAYQALIIAEHRRCGGRGWLLYDTAFRQQITDIRNADFSRLNQSLYLTTFVAYGGKGRSCSRCLMSDHTQEECALHQFLSQSANEGGKIELRKEPGKVEERPRLKRRGACFAWNDGNCRLPYCRFEHVCSKCYGNHRRDACRSRAEEGERGGGHLRGPERRRL